MRESFAPMLAKGPAVTTAEALVDHLFAIEAYLRNSPIIVSPKLDGIRCLCTSEGAVSRKLKPIANEHIRAQLSRPEFVGLDGELVVRPTDGELSAFQDNSSAIMSHDGTPNFEFRVFDDFSVPHASFVSRLNRLDARFDSLASSKFIVPVPQAVCRTMADVLSYEELALSEGYEGLVLRSPNQPYKYGRSTVREFGMVKLKRFIDGEAKIVGYHQAMENANAAGLDNLGHAKRSQAQDGMRPKDTMGSFDVVDVATGVAFRITAGPKAADAAQQWDMRDRLLDGSWLVSYRYQPSGVKEKPRFPVMRGLRNVGDL